MLMNGGGAQCVCVVCTIRELLESICLRQHVYSMCTRGRAVLFLLLLSLGVT